MDIVLATNCLLMSLSCKGRYFTVWKSLLEGRYTLCLTNDILAEYEEIITMHVGASVADSVISTIINLSNIRMLDIYYHFNLIKADPDDNKFVDCAIKANAKYIVTQDNHFNVLKDCQFPKVDIVDIDYFCKMLS